MKCQICKTNEATWSKQYIADDRPTYTLPGSHYRGFIVIKVCDECKKRAQRQDAVSDTIKVVK